MKILMHTLLLLFYLNTFSGYAQSPQFTQNLSADNGNVCYGAHVTYSTAVVNATHYAFQLRNPENGNWSKISEGSIPATLNNLEHTIYGLSASPTVRVLIVNGTDSVYSNQHSVNVHRPIFDFHPSSLIQCNGEDAVFRISSPNGNVFQWQGSTDGGASFTDLLVTPKFKNVTTPHLTVTGIINDHNGQVFRCKVTDAFGCEEFSDADVFAVNVFLR
jgi:hypothetical protein